MLQGWQDFRTGCLGDAPSTPPSTPPSNCPDCSTLNTQTRSVTNCASDSIEDQYITGSYTPSSSSLNGTALNCSASLSAILFDGSPTLDISVRSGDGCPLAGFTIWKTISGSQQEINTRVFYNGTTSGQPISGMCWCVGTSSTPCNFTGYVCLFDHVNDRIIFGYYVNQNLLTDTPTILVTHSGTSTSGDLEAYLSMVAAPFNAFELTDDGGFTNVVEYLDLSAITPSIIPWTKNYGFVWIGNSAAGIHEANWIDSPGWASVFGGP